MSYFEIVITSLLLLIPIGIGGCFWAWLRQAKKTRNRYYQEFMNRKAQRSQEKSQ